MVRPSPSPEALPGVLPGRSELPARARVVVVGGGVGGTSVAYHLAELGERDVLLVERAELTAGSTFHSAGLVGQLRADPALTRMNMGSVDLYRRLQAGEHPPGWVESGSIKLASSPERLDEIRRQVSWARTYGLPLEEIGPAEVAELFPLADLDGVVGACVMPSDGQLDPSQLTYALAAGARAGGVLIATRTRVLGIDTAHGRYGRRVTRVRTDRGDVECEVVVDCGGMYAAEIARMVGVRVPIVPMSHQYVVTEAMPAVVAASRDRPLPSLRDPDLLVYYRQEVDGLVMGGYERDPAPFTATASGYDAIPADFNARLLPEDWSRLEEISTNAQRRVPAMAETGIRRFVNGPEGFTPDNEFCLGETSVAGFFVAAGFCAHGIAGAGGIGRVMAEWIVAGDPGLDVWHMDIRRFGAAYTSPSYTLARTVETYATYYDIAYPNRQRRSGRPLRTSPVYGWHAARAATFGEKAGWERVEHYAHDPLAALIKEQVAIKEFLVDGVERNSLIATDSLIATCSLISAEGVDAWRPRGWAGRDWSPSVVVEHLATRASAGLFDETSFAKIDVGGPDAAAFLERVCDNHVARGIGDVTYTQCLNDRGGIEMDVTVTRLAQDRFRIITGTAFGSHDLGWLRRQARLLDADVRLDDVSGSEACFALWGPRARAILGRITPADLADAAFPFMTARQITVGDVPVRAVRVTFVGELGWELYASAEYGLALWETLLDAGGEALTVAGYRAIESLRLEKAYRVWSTDITPETNPYEAGLGFCVKLDKPGGFVGADALRRVKAEGVRRRLACLVLDDPGEVVLGGEPVLAGDDVLGRVTSGGQGYTLGASIAYAYLPVESATAGTRVALDLFGVRQPAVVVKAPLVDPAGARVRG
ncbi:MAG TPA: FAD-dependent oxidoreductase [Kineosporiaceae bacterium]|nr:FAD-dependent oxidoreductase [Kineosporiaceae bacterium]